MLQLTKRTEYGLIALVHLADRVGEVVSAREICDQYPVPRRLLAEVMKDLLRAGLVDSTLGASGGYQLTRSAENISLGEIVAAIEGAPSLTSCEGHADGTDTQCEVHPVCPIRSPLQRVRHGIWVLLHSTTLSSLTAESATPMATLATESISPR
jgi:Rrf2 family protein